MIFDDDEDDSALYRPRREDCGGDCGSCKRCRDRERLDERDQRERDNDERGRP